MPMSDGRGISVAERSILEGGIRFFVGVHGIRRVPVRILPSCSGADFWSCRLL